MKTSRTLEFESPQFLHALFGNNLSLLKDLETTFHVSTTTRDGWLKLQGEPSDLDLACSLIEKLEASHRQGTEITEHVFALALKSAHEGNEDAGLEQLRNCRLVISASRQPVAPKTRGQIRYLAALQEHEVVFGVGPAGTGKTYLAMAKALSLLKDKEIDRVVLTRPAVEAGEALGFLPGDLKEKIFPYLRPLYDALYDMLDPDEVERYIDRGMIEIAPLAYMRGRTLNRACVLLDEAQNTTCEQMFMFLTRLGRDSQCIVTGDNSQVDLKRGIRSGLDEAIDNLRGVSGIHFQFFQREDVIRHPVVQRIIDAYEKHRKPPAAPPRGGAPARMGAKA